MHVILSGSIQSSISNLMELTTKTPLIEMEEVAKIFNLTCKFKTFIEEKYKSILVPRRDHYETIREEKMLSLGVQQQNEIKFTRLND